MFHDPNILRDLISFNNIIYSFKMKILFGKLLPFTSWKWLLILQVGNSSVLTDLESFFHSQVENICLFSACRKVLWNIPLLPVPTLTTITCPSTRSKLIWQCMSQLSAWNLIKRNPPGDVWTVSLRGGSSRFLFIRPSSFCCSTNSKGFSSGVVPLPITLKK